MLGQWSDYFDIVVKEQDDYVGLRAAWLDPEWNLIVKGTNEVVGTYRDYKYAIKQAKYKFKKISSRVEKILLG